MPPLFNIFNWWQCFGWLFLLLGCNYQRATADDFHVSVTGETIDVWSAIDTLRKCKIIDAPDIPARAFIDRNGLAHLIDGSTAFHIMNGPSIFNVTRSCNVSWNMTGDPDPAMFAGDEFLDSTFAFSNGTVISLVHTEFPGNVYNRCSGPAYPYCWIVTIGLAISDDWGQTWRHARPPPHHLVAAVPYTYNETQLACGWGAPSNIVHNTKDNYYYVAMWNKHRVGEQEAGTCIVRTNNLMDPSSWRGWNGNSFNVTFVSPYRGKKSNDTPVAVEGHLCTVVDNIPPLCAALGLSWSTYLEKFVATIGCFGEMSKAFYVTTSDDMIHWEKIQVLFSFEDIPTDLREIVTSIKYPTFLDPHSGDPNFGTIGREPFLYWVSLGHSPHTDGRHLWATPMKFSTLKSSKQGGQTTFQKVSQVAVSVH